MVVLELRHPFLVHQLPIRAGVGVVLMLELLEPAALVVVVTVKIQVLLPVLLGTTEPQTPAVVEAQVLLLAAVAAQAAPASSSSNTPHLLNPYLHSKVLARGLHLLA